MYRYERKCGYSYEEKTEIEIETWMRKWTFRGAKVPGLGVSKIRGPKINP